MGYLPVWDLCGRDNYCMIANHSVPTVVDACLRNLPGVDPERAYAAVRASLTNSHEKSDWDIYDRYGYYPFDLVREESVSRTLESCYDDWCAAQLAGRLGKAEDYDFFLARSRNYRNLFDPSTGFFRGRDSKGAWRVLHDTEDLIKLLGGRDEFLSKLDSLFAFEAPASLTGESNDITGLIGQYSHGNEPCHHVIYLYTLAGRRDKAEELVRRVFRDFYRNEPEDFAGTTTAAR